MPYQSIFKRYELKYLLTKEQKESLLDAMQPYMIPDKYGHSTIRNIYFDTDTYRLIRQSVEKPFYKEKLRIRSYAQASPDSTVFAELKKKYDGIVYKRRVSLPEAEAMAWLCGTQHCRMKTQITDEIDYFLSYYETLRPTVFISYEREAYYTRESSDFRLTLDDAILCRREDLSLCSPVYGTPLLPDGTVLMEIKCSGGIPLWMVHFLTEERIYKTTFSKYGTAYAQMIFPEKILQSQEEALHV